MTAGLAEPRARALVLGIGNLLLADDGVGLRLLEDLRREAGDPGDVEFVDGGTQGLALLGRLANRPAVLILDAVALGAPPGTVHVLDQEAIDGLHARGGFTAHEGNGLEILALAKLLGEAPGKVVILGVEPEQVKTGIGLSHAVESALPLALVEARRILAAARMGEQHVSGSSG